MFKTILSKVTCTISINKPVFVHSFGLSENARTFQAYVKVAAIKGFINLFPQRK